jgi:hypothetical protein
MYAYIYLFFYIKEKGSLYMNKIKIVLLLVYSFFVGKHTIAYEQASFETVQSKNINCRVKKKSSLAVGSVEQETREAVRKKLLWGSFQTLVTLGAGAILINDGCQFYKASTLDTKMVVAECVILIGVGLGMGIYAVKNFMAAYKIKKSPFLLKMKNRPNI